MGVSSLRPLLLLVGGAAVGSLVTFGLLRRTASIHEGSVESQISSTASTITPAQTTSETSKITPVPKEEADDNAPEETAANQAPADSEGSVDYRGLASLKTAQARHVPIRPFPKPAMVFGSNGLPVGVTSDAGKSDVYARFPGLQPPLINRDGRDMGPEAIQMLETPREEVPFPGGTSSASASPLPFPQTAEEANRQVQGNSSPQTPP
jgi:hypothetical protein